MSRARRRPTCPRRAPGRTRPEGPATPGAPASRGDERRAAASEREGLSKWARIQAYGGAGTRRQRVRAPGPAARGNGTTLRAARLESQETLPLVADLYVARRGAAGSRAEVTQASRPSEAGSPRPAGGPRTGEISRWSATRAGGWGRAPRPQSASTRERSGPPGSRRDPPITEWLWTHVDRIVPICSGFWTKDVRQILCVISDLSRP